MTGRPADPARLRIALVAPVAQSVPPHRSGSVETVTSLLADGLAGRGHDLTLFATADSITQGRLHATFERGYHHDETLWPWELCELFNLAAAVERQSAFDLVHHQAEYSPLALAYHRVSRTPILQTLHHMPDPSETTLWSRYPDARFVAVSSVQARALRRVTVVATIPHAVDTSRLTYRSQPADYLLFLGRFTEGKGVLTAIEVARRAGHRLILAAAENDYYREAVAPHVDHHHVIYAGEVGGSEKVELLGGARALLYPVQAPEPFGLVLAEAMACGTPVAALNQGAVPELVDVGLTGVVADTPDALVRALPGVLALDRAKVRARAVERFGPERLVDDHVALYRRLASEPPTGGLP